MSPDKQIAAIAAACGWKPTTDSGICWDASGNPLVSAPNYLSDLNAMHEAEKMLTEVQQQVFLYQLHGERVTTNAWLLVHTTAAQRAEAFLRALGKWEARR